MLDIPAPIVGQNPYREGGQLPIPQFPVPGELSVTDKATMWDSHDKIQQIDMQSLGDAG